MSRHDPMSDLSRLNRKAARRWVKVHRWTAQVLHAAKRFSEESKGAFDITLGAGGSWRDVMVGGDNCIKFRRRLTLDLGGIAKGFAVDRAVAVMRSAGAVSGMVNAGGDLRVFGREPQPVQIRDPLDPLRAAGTVFLRDRALATSGLYFAPELFDGRSGEPMQENVSVTVGAADCLTADALTKVAFVLREWSKGLLEQYEAEAFLLDGKSSPRWLSRNDAAGQLHQT